MRLYHFTSREHLASIRCDGYLRLTESNVSAPWQHLAMTPVVWFVDTPVLQHDHGLGGSAVDKRDVRIAVDVPESWTLRWLDWANGQGIDGHWLNALVDAAGGFEAAAHWWVTFRVVHHDRWVEVAVRSGDNSTYCVVEST